MTSEVKLYIQSKNSYLYPDAMVIYGDIQKSDDEINAVTNPATIVEVLSKTSSDYDRGDKFYFYRQLDSLKEYILIEQNKPQIEIYKKETDLWKITRITGLDSSIYLHSLGLELKLGDVYENVEFEKKG